MRGGKFSWTGEDSVKEIMERMRTHIGTIESIVPKAYEEIKKTNGEESNRLRLYRSALTYAINELENDNVFLQNLAKDFLREKKGNKETFLLEYQPIKESLAKYFRDSPWAIRPFMNHMRSFRNAQVRTTDVTMNLYNLPIENIKKGNSNRKLYNPK